MFAKRFFILTVLFVLCYTANAQRRAGKDTILITRTWQDSKTSSDSLSFSSYTSYTIDLYSIFIETIRIDSIPDNIKTSQILVSVTIDSNCNVTVNNVTGNPKHEYLIRKTKEYFTSSVILFITTEGVVLNNCGGVSYNMTLPVRYRFN